MTKNISDIEKCAKLMGYEVNHYYEDLNAVGLKRAKPDGEWIFNPRKNKADLMDLECELGIDVEWDDAHLWPNVACTKRIGGKFAYRKVWLRDHPTKFAARAEAVIAVAVQIYDAKYGKDGE